MRKFRIAEPVPRATVNPPLESGRVDCRCSNEETKEWHAAFAFEPLAAKSARWIRERPETSTGMSGISGVVTTTTNALGPEQVES
jgi:hypothetical protein